MPATQAAPNPSRGAVASAWHTIIVLLVLFGVSAVGARTGNLPGVSGHGRASGYILIMTVEWITVAFIWYGIHRRGISMRDLVGGRWARPVEVLRDLGIGIAFLLICGVGVVNALGYVLKATPNQAIRNMYPHGPGEVALWVLLALTAGFCEEVIFRGYLQRQFAALTHAAAGGIVLQGIVFGASHGYQGWKFMLLISVYGALFGMLASWRRSLRPGMFAHFLQDGVGGLLASHFSGLIRL